MAWSYGSSIVEGESADAIAAKVGLDRNSVILCLKKFRRCCRKRDLRYTGKGTSGLFWQGPHAFPVRDIAGDSMCFIPQSCQFVHSIFRLLCIPPEQYDDSTPGIPLAEARPMPLPPPEMTQTVLFISVSLPILHPCFEGSFMKRRNIRLMSGMFALCSTNSIKAISKMCICLSGKKDQKRCPPPPPKLPLFVFFFSHQRIRNFANGAVIRGLAIPPATCSRVSSESSL